MKTLRVMALVVGISVVAGQPAEAGVLRWVAHQTWRCPVIKGAVTGAAKGAVAGAKAALEGTKAVAGVVY